MGFWSMCTGPRKDAVSNDQVTQMIEKIVADNKVVVFSKIHCPYCKKAKAALGQYLEPEQIHIVELDGRIDSSEIQDALLDKTGARTVPRVFICGVFVGGGDDTALKARNGELKSLLVSCGISCKL